MSTSHLIKKHFIRQISRFGTQNFTQLLNEQMLKQSKFQSELFRQKILALKHTAAAHGLVSLSANQLSLKNRIFVIMKRQLIKYQKWTGYEELFQKIRPEDCYDTIINPELLGHSTFKIKGSEECPTIEGLKFKVWVPLSNQMKFVKYVEKFQKGKMTCQFLNCREEFKGFYGRVFDHQFRHLEGILPNLSEICNDQVYLTDDAKMEPENYEFLKNHKLEKQVFSEDNLKLQAKKQQQLRKKQKQMQLLNPKSKFDPSQIPDKLDVKKTNKSLGQSIQLKNPSKGKKQPKSSSNRSNNSKK